MRNIEIVRRRTLWGYKGDDWLPFLKITVVDPISLPKVRDKYSLIVLMPIPILIFFCVR